MAKKSNAVTVDETAPETEQESIKMTESPYANITGKTPFCAEVWRNNPDLSAKEILDLATKIRPEMGLLLSDVTNGKTKWKKDDGITTGTRQKRTPGTTSISDASVYESAFHFVETCDGVENAIAILERLKNLKDLL